MAANEPNSFGIRDNPTRGKIADFLVEKINVGSHLSVVSAYFTIYAYEALLAELDGIGHLNFLFGEPRFIASLDPDKTDKKSFKIVDEGLELANRLQQEEIARWCAAWIREKVEIRSVRQANLLHGKLYHIDDGQREHAILGSCNFTQRGLGLAATPNKLAEFQAQISEIETYRKVVPNPLSHEHPTTLTQAKIQAAITAIEELDKVLK